MGVRWGPSLPTPNPLPRSRGAPGRKPPEHSSARESEPGEPRNHSVVLSISRATISRMEHDHCYLALALSVGRFLIGAIPLFKKI